MTKASSTSSNAGGISFLSMLTIVFVILKLTGVIGWSWWWVLAPTWIPAAFVLLGLVMFGVGALVVFLVWKTTVARQRRRVLTALMRANVRAGR